MSKILVVDGNSLMHRAFHALPLLTDEKGRYTNAVFGFLGMLLRLLKEEQPTHAAVAFDMHAPTFRHKQFEAYKAGRKATPEELRPQFDLCKQALQAMGVAILEREGFEADDILGTLARIAQEKQAQAVLVTGDRDALQLVAPHAVVLYTKRGISDTDRMDEQAVLDKWGVTPDRVPDLKGLMGDSSDNIPGVPGVGEKTARTLLQKFGDLESVLAHAEEAGGPKLRASLKTYADQARMSRDLATIDTHIPGGFDWDALQFTYPDVQTVRPAFTELGFVSLLKRMGGASSGAEELEPAAYPQVEQKVVSQLEDLRAIIIAHPGPWGILWEAERISLACDEATAYEVPFAMTLLGDGVDPDRARQIVAELLADPQIDKIVFDAKSLAHALVPFGVCLGGGVQDAMLAAYVCNPAQGQKGLDKLCQAYQLCPEGQPATAAHLFRLFHLLDAQMHRDEVYAVYQDLELPLWPVLFAMEREGFRVDTGVLKQMSDAYGERLRAIEDQVHALAGHPFNLNSTKQLGEVLFEELKLPALKKTKTGYSTDIAVLEQLVDVHPMIAPMIEYRKLSKLKSTYLDGLQAVADEQGRVHTRFTQNVTATGRISSLEPNLQNIPVRTEQGREIRRAFIASAPGRVLVTGDYSQIELRILAHMAQEDHMRDVFAHGGDIHTSTAALVNHVPVEQVTKQMRSAAKAVNFGIVYGISDFGLSQNLHITRKQAAATIEQYLNTYPRIRSYMDTCIAQGKTDGYVTTLFGRRRYTPELRSKNYNQRSFGERIAMNAPIQGTAADIIKAAMIAVYDRLARELPDAKLILQVHDELIVDCASQDAQKVQQLMHACMEHVVELSVPLEVEVSQGENWLEAK